MVPSIIDVRAYDREFCSFTMCMSSSAVVKSDLGGDPCTTTENVAYAATVKFATHDPVYEDIPRSDNSS